MGKELEKLAISLASKFGSTATAMDPDGHAWMFDVGGARVEVNSVGEGPDSLGGFELMVFLNGEDVGGQADIHVEFVDFSDEAAKEAEADIKQATKYEPMERDRPDDLEAAKKENKKMLKREGLYSKKDFKAILTFKAEFSLKPANGRLQELGDLGYLTIEGIEDPGASPPGGMNDSDWAIYRSNWEACCTRLPEGGEEGQAAFLKEHPEEEYRGDVVYDEGLINIYKGASSSVAAANAIIGELQSYPILDEELFSKLEFEKRAEAIESWAMDEALGMLGMGRNVEWTEWLSPEEAAWLEETDPQVRSSVINSIENFMMGQDAKEVLWDAVEEDLAYGDGTALHEENLKKVLGRTAAGKALLDPQAVVHSYVRSKMGTAGEPGTKEYQQALEDQGQIKLFESLKAVIAAKEIMMMAEADNTANSLLTDANILASLVQGAPASLSLVSSKKAIVVFPYGQGMIASLSKFMDGSYGVSFAPAKVFASIKDASFVLGSRVMASFETGAKFQDVAKVMADKIDPEDPELGEISKVEELTAEEAQDRYPELWSSLTPDEQKNLQKDGAVVVESEQAGKLLVHPHYFESLIELVGKWMDKKGYVPHSGKNTSCMASRERMKVWAKTPKGYADIVNEFKANQEVKNPWLLARRVRAGSVYEYKLRSEGDKVMLVSLDNAGNVIKKIPFDSREEAIRSANAEQDKEGIFVNISEDKTPEEA